MMLKVYLDSVGCRLNQSEVEKMGNQLIRAGCQLVARADEADIVIINTCAVTAQAASDSRAKARQAARAGVKSIVVTGCWATIDKEAAQNLPNVDFVISNDQKEDLVRLVLKLPQATFDLEPLERHPLPGAHARTRAFIKVQDGCDNFCTYCITRIARGRGRSRPLEDVLLDIKAAEKGGVKEVVLSGVHLASWGQDFSEKQTLRQLVEAVLERCDVARIRLSSLEAWDLDEKFFGLWKDKRLCPHLHLPLQSGSAGVLKRMARKITPQQYEQVVDWARSAEPVMAVTTDLMTGFPGETAAEFDESVKFVEKMGFAGGHVFSYSPRPGTAAVKLPDAVVADIKKQRSAVMRSLVDELSDKFRQQCIGQVRPVLWETRQPRNGGNYVEGLTDHYVRVRVKTEAALWNEVCQVRLDNLTPEGMEGSLV